MTGVKPSSRLAPVLAAFVAAASAPPVEATTTIFLNDCLPDGCMLTAGTDNSSLNRSSIISGASSLGGFPFGAELWNQLVTCVQEVWRPFDVVVTDVDPAPADHLEQMIGGASENLGFPEGVGGVSPFTCAFIPNSISFTFPGVWGPDLLDLCWTASQELAHQFGLDHEAFKPDPMTYIAGCGRKDFSDVTAACGETAPRPCYCGGSTQNSYQLLAARAGTAAFLFEGTFEDVDADWICDWSAQSPAPSAGAEPRFATDPGRPTCATFDSENRGLRLPPLAAP